MKTTSIWLNGLSGAGKTTLALALKKQLINKGLKVIILDGDLLRKGINKDLGFSAADRTENLRRTAEINLLFLSEDYVVINAFIAPSAEIRDMIREILSEVDLFEIGLSTPLAVCVERDVKGLYNLAKQGVIKNMTGIHEAFEPSQSANLTLDTSGKSIDSCIEIIMATLYNEISVATQNIV